MVQKTELKPEELITGSITKTIKNITKLMDKTKILNRIPILSPPRKRIRLNPDLIKDTLNNIPTKIQMNLLEYLKGKSGKNTT